VAGFSKLFNEICIIPVESWLSTYCCVILTEEGKIKMGVESHCAVVNVRLWDICVVVDLRDQELYLTKTKGKYG